jgi:hypothetical protein
MQIATACGDGVNSFLPFADVSRLLSGHDIMILVRPFVGGLLSLLLLSACNSDPAGVGKTLPVAGIITSDGKPFTVGTIAFMPDRQKGNTSPHTPGSEIGPDGSYSLITATKPGAPPGWYKVVIVATEPPNPKDPFANRRSFIDTRYGTAEKTPLEIEVVEAPAAGSYDLTLKGPSR